METLIIKIKIQGIVVTTFKSMDIFLSIRKHFRSDCKRWLSQTTCFSYFKTSHISQYCPTRSKEPSCEFNKGKGKANIEYVQNEINKTWKRKEDCNTSSREGITLPNGLGDHTTSS